LWQPVEYHHGAGLWLYTFIDKEKDKAIQYIKINISQSHCLLFVEVDAVMVLTAGITTTTWVLSVFA